MSMKHSELNFNPKNVTTLWLILLKRESNKAMIITSKSIVDFHHISMTDTIETDEKPGTSNQDARRKRGKVCCHLSQNII